MITPMDGKFRSMKNCLFKIMSFKFQIITKWIGVQCSFREPFEGDPNWLFKIPEVSMVYDWLFTYLNIDQDMQMFTANAIENRPITMRVQCGTDQRNVQCLRSGITE